MAGRSSTGLIRGDVMSGQRNASRKYIVGCACAAIGPTGGVGQVVVDRSYDTIHIEGDVTNLTINGSGVTVLVDYAENVVINDGSSNHVYVRDTKNVTVTSSYNTVLWAGNTPQIQDLGNGNTIKNQTEDKR